MTFPFETFIIVTKGDVFLFKGSNYVYYFMYLVGFAIMMILNIKKYRFYKMTKRRAVGLTLLTYVSGVTGAVIMGKIYTSLMLKAGVTDSSNVAIFGAVIFCPAFILAYLIISQKLFGAKKSSFRNDMDILTPGIFIILTCAKFGCFLNGCCRGIECSFGISYQNSDAVYFPVQIFEVLTMIIILLAARYYTFNSGRFIKGTAYPVTAMMYSACRFGWEFMRDYPSDKVRHMIAGLTFWQFCCVIVFISSLVIFFVMKNIKEQPQEKNKKNKSR